MMLSALIRKRRNATATVATPATHKGAKAGTVANVASVAVANQLLAEEETAIRAWLAHIEETDPATIADVLVRCQTDAQARAYCLEQAREVLPPPEPDYTATPTLGTAPNANLKPLQGFGTLIGDGADPMNKHLIGRR